MYVCNIIGFIDYVCFRKKYEFEIVKEGKEKDGGEVRKLMLIFF